MKVAPLYHALKASDWAEPLLVHTGQHYDHNMSDAILQDLRVPAPDFHLVDGKIVEEHELIDELGMMQQLGMELRPASVGD